MTPHPTPSPPSQVSPSPSPPLSRSLLSWVGISLLSLGVVWESFRAPNLPGWGVVLLGFLLIFWGERRRPRRTPFDWPAALLLVMAGVSLLVTAIPETTLAQAARLAAGLAMGYGLVNWAGDRRRLLTTGWGLTLGGVALALAAPFVVDWNRAKLVLIPAAVYQYFPLLVSNAVHPNILAALLALLFPFPLAWLLSPRGASGGGRWAAWGVRAFTGAACLLMGIVLVLSKSRGGYIAGAVGALATLALLVRRRWAWLVLLLLVVALVGGGAWFILGSGGEALDSPELVEGAANPATWAFRLGVWRAAVWMMADFPFTGVGMGLFNEVGALLYAHYAPNNPGAHNLYLQVGVDLGVPGLIAFLAVLMLALWMAAAAMRRFTRRGDSPLRAEAAAALAGLIALMTHGLVDIGVWSTRGGFVPWAVMGLAAALYSVAQTSSVSGDAEPRSFTST